MLIAAATASYEYHEDKKQNGADWHSRSPEGPPYGWNGRYASPQAVVPQPYAVEKPSIFRTTEPLLFKLTLRTIRSILS